MNIVEYSSDQYQQAISRKSKLLKYLGYSRIVKLTKAGKFLEIPSSIFLQATVIINVNIIRYCDKSVYKG